MKEKYSAVILVGGLSSRMGTPKYQLKYLEETFLEIITNVLPEVDIKYSVYNYLEDIELKLQILDDTKKQIGPIGGIYSALNQAESEFVIIISCDLPKINTNIINSLIAQSAITNKTTIAQIDNRAMPTLGIYKKEEVKIVKKAIDLGDYKLMNLLKYLDISYCKFSASEKQYLVNINTEQAYKALTKPKVICVTGYKNSGKTTLMVELIKKLKKDNKTVVAIKHDGHDFNLLDDVDSSNFFNHGADQVLLYSDYKYLTINNQKIEIEKYISQIKDVDVILIEGLKDSKFRKIVIENDEKLEVTNRILTINCDSRNKINKIYSSILKELDD